MTYRLNYEVVQNFLDEKKMGEEEFIKEANISKCDLDKLKANDHSISFSVLEKISGYLGISIINLISFSSSKSSAFTILR